MHNLFDWPKDGELQAAVLRFSFFKSLLAETSSQWAGLFCILDVLHSFDANANLLDAYHAIVQSDAGLSSAACTWIEDNDWGISRRIADTG